MAKSTTPTDESIVRGRQDTAREAREAPYVAFIAEILPIIERLRPHAARELNARNYPNAQLVRIEHRRKSTQTMAWPLASHSGVWLLKDGNLVSGSDPALPYTPHPEPTEAGRYLVGELVRSIIKLLPADSQDAWLEHIDAVEKRHFP